MKVAPIMLAFSERPQIFEPTLVHTGQHYDAVMSDVFFSDLELRAPDSYLGVGSGSHAEQTAGVLVAFEKVIAESRPDIVLVAGDVNSTLACSLAARKLDIPLGHIEAGLRSRNWTMPEETNRVLTDVMSDYLFTPSLDANDNLLSEGIGEERIHFVGNVMIDSLARALPTARRRGTRESLGLKEGAYGLITLHRPSNIDHADQLSAILAALDQSIPKGVFPVHPRTQKKIEELRRDGFQMSDTVNLIEPLGYYDFVNLLSEAAFVLTDSGGIQEETTYLGIPCLTLREETERPITVTQGTNELTTLETLSDQVETILGGSWKKGVVPELWDGKTAGRIADVLAPGITAQL